MGLENIFAKRTGTKSSDSENQKKSEIKTAKFDIKTLILDSKKRVAFISLLNQVKNKVDSVKDNKIEKGEWETFFARFGFNSMYEVSDVINIFIRILTKADLLAAMTQKKNIDKIVDNFGAINAFLTERGLNLAEAV